MTRRQVECFRFIGAYQSENGRSPSFHEMRRHLGLASTCGVNRILNGLERSGWISREKRRHRAITINKEQDA